MTPFMLFAHGQVWQVDWIATLNRNLLLDIVHRQYFDHSLPFAILTGVLIVAAIGGLPGWPACRARPARPAACWWPAPRGSSFPPACS